MNVNFVEIYNESGLMLIAAESVNLQRSKLNACCWFNGSIETVAVIICTPDEIYALDMDATLIDLDQFRQEHPDLDAILASSKKS